MLDAPSSLGANVRLLLAKLIHRCFLHCLNSCICQCHQHCSLRSHRLFCLLVACNTHHRTEGVRNYTTQQSNKLVEEFMLLANMSVARRIYNHFPKLALLRRHEPPHDNKMDEVIWLLLRKPYLTSVAMNGVLFHSMTRVYLTRTPSSSSFSSSFFSSSTATFGV